MYILAVLLLLTTAPPILAGEDEEIPFADADIFFELNDTDGDLGIHGLIDGEAWRWIQIESPDERRKMRVSANGSLRRHGVTELFFESAEPTFDELNPRRFFHRFPEGIWEVEGMTIDGEEMESETYLSHVIPAAPDNVTANYTAVPEDCDEDPVPVVNAPVTIRWDPVEENHEELGREGDVEVEAYQLVIEIEESGVTLTVDLTPDVTEYELSESFTNLGSEYKIEVLVESDTGNKSALESCFEVD
jgi:hypothetical protein